MPPSRRDQLLAATNFADLAAAAGADLIDRTLHVSLLEWVLEADVTGKARTVLQTAYQRKVARTPMDLLTKPRAPDFLRIEGSRAIHDAVVAAVRQTLLDALPVSRKAIVPVQAAPTDAPPQPGAPPDVWWTWARANQVDAELTMPSSILRSLAPANEEAFFWYGQEQFPTVLSVLTFSSKVRRGWSMPSTKLQTGMRTWLIERVTERNLGRAEAAARDLKPAPVLADARIHPLWQRLEAAVQSARLTTAWLPAELMYGARLRATTDPVTAVCALPDPPWCRRSSVELTIVLEPADQPIALDTTCPVHGANCPFALLAMRAVQASLGQPEAQAFVERILTELATPWWQRTLADLNPQPDSHVGPVVDPDARVGWRLAFWTGHVARLEPVLVTPKKRGDGVKLKRLKPADLETGGWPLLPVDVEVATLLVPDRSRSTDADRLSGLVAVLLDKLAGHPRLFAGDAALPLRIVQTEARLAVTAQADGGVRVSVQAGPQVWTPREFLTVTATRVGRWLARVDLAQGDVMLVASDNRLEALVRTLARRFDHFPAESAPPLVDHLLATLGSAVDVPAEWRGERQDPDPDTVLRLDPLEGTSLLVRATVQPLGPELLRGQGSRTVAPGEGTAVWNGQARGQRVWVERDLPREVADAQARSQALGLHANFETAPWTWTLHDEAALDLLATLGAGVPGVRVEWIEPQRRRTVRTALGRDLRIDLSSKRDWFGVQGGVDVDGQHIPMADLIAALRAGKRYVKAQGDVLVRLADDLRKALQPVADLAQDGRSGLELSPLHAGMLQDLPDAQVNAPPRWHELLAKVRAAPTLDTEVPAGLRATLRDYQRDGFRWLVRMASWSTGACLADDMGLGKTVQALAFLLHRAALGPALVVAPLSVTFNWQREAAAFAPDLRVRTLRELGAENLPTLGPNDVVVVGYDLMLRHAEALQAVDFATLVLDEAQAVKNAGTRRAQVVHGLQARFRLALTGTPVENRIAELWALFRVIAPGMLGSWDQFRERFGTPIERHGDPRARQALAKVVRAFLLRRLKRDVATELPARTEITLDVVLSAEERRLYDTQRAAAVAQLSGSLGNVAPEQRRFQVLAALTKLRQLACHPRLLEPESVVASSKLQTLLEHLQELCAEGHRALVFSQFTRHLALVRTALTEAGLRWRYLDGDTPEKQRRAEVDAFQQGDGDVFLLSLKAGGTGLNLTGADYVFHLDPWWNPAVEDQATDRAHRIGQTRPVTVFRLVARGTVEEAILQMHADKRDLVAGLLDGTGTATAVTTDELLGLLTGVASGVLPELEPEAVAPERVPIVAPEPVRARKLRVVAPEVAPEPVQPPIVPQPEPGQAFDLEVALDRLRAALNDGSLKPGSVGVYLSALRRFGEWLTATGRVVDGPHALTEALDAFVADGKATRNGVTVSLASSGKAVRQRWVALPGR
jgi:superfamily II DNA or RNA helicase